MKLLLDTHLWAAGQPDRLSPVARAVLDGDDYHIVQRREPVGDRHQARAGTRGPSRGTAPPAAPALGQRLAELPLTGEHAVTIGSLPPIPKGPFDRILLLAAHVEGVALLTVDARLSQYPGPVRQV